MITGFSWLVLDNVESPFSSLDQCLDPACRPCGMGRVSLGLQLKVLRCTVSSHLGSEQLEPSPSGSRWLCEVIVT